MEVLDLCWLVFAPMWPVRPISGAQLGIVDAMPQHLERSVGKMGPSLPLLGAIRANLAAVSGGKLLASALKVQNSATFPARGRPTCAPPDPKPCKMRDFGALANRPEACVAAVHGGSRGL